MKSSYRRSQPFTNAQPATKNRIVSVTKKRSNMFHLCEVAVTQLFSLAGPKCSCWASFQRVARAAGRFEALAVAWGPVWQTATSAQHFPPDAIFQPTFTLKRET